MPNEPTDLKATDAAQRKAGELGVDLDEVQGTGQEGQIVVGDIERAANEGKASDVKMVRLSPAFGPGEYVVTHSIEDDVHERSVFAAGVDTPVGSSHYDSLPKDDDGNLAYPLVDVDESDQQTHR